MHINHVALWVNDLEKMKDFYCTYFRGQSNEKYQNEAKGFESYFVSFGNSARIELMKSTSHTEKPDYANATGLVHIAISVGNKQLVDNLTEKIKKAGFEIVSNPRTTGDGYYESVISDPEGNLVEITV